jgi:hypothetical protein
MARSRLQGDPVTVSSAGSCSRRLMQAPADRAAGSRGPRAKLAGLVAVGGLLLLSFSSFSRDPAWAGIAFACAAATLMAAAVLLWIARGGRALALGVALIPLAAAGGVAAEVARDRAEHEAAKWGGSVFSFERKGRILTRAQAEAVPTGVTQERLTARLGPPAGRGVQRVFGEPDMRCLGYRSVEREGGIPRLHAFCFSDGRYAALREW